MRETFGWDDKTIAKEWSDGALRSWQAQVTVWKAAQYDKAVADARNARPVQPKPGLPPGTPAPHGANGSADDQVAKAAGRGDMASYIKMRNAGKGTRLTVSP